MNFHNLSTKKSSNTPSINNTQFHIKMKDRKKETVEVVEDVTTIEGAVVIRPKTKRKKAAIAEVNPNLDQSRPEYLKPPLTNTRRSLKQTSNCKRSTTTPFLITWTPRKLNTNCPRRRSHLQFKTEFHKAVFLLKLHILTKLFHKIHKT